MIVNEITISDSLLAQIKKKQYEAGYEAGYEAAIAATKKQVYQAIRDAETPYTQLTLGQQEMIKAAIGGIK